MFSCVLTTVSPNTRQYHSVLRSRSLTVKATWLVPTSRLGIALSSRLAAARPDPRAARAESRAQWQR